jgi:hypothetical protein
MKYNDHKSEMSVDEIISSLQHSKIPTVIIEGRDDTIVYRFMEELFFDIELSVMPAGGKPNVLEIFRRRHEMPNIHSIAFIVDRDCWIFSGVPSEYVCDNLFLTHGYSVENDVFLDGNLKELMSRSEKNKFESEIEIFLKWYAVAIMRQLESGSEKLDVHANTLLDNSEKMSELCALKIRGGISC